MRTREQCLSKWKYYRHALVPAGGAHEEADVQCLESDWRSTWGGEAYFARWTECFDSVAGTPWWYVIKDTKFDISELKAKKRYKINKANRNFTVKRIRPEEYISELYRCAGKSYEGYPECYRSVLPTMDEFRVDVLHYWTHEVIYAAFGKENNELCGYARLLDAG